MVHSRVLHRQALHPCHDNAMLIKLLPSAAVIALQMHLTESISVRRLRQSVSALQRLAWETQSRSRQAAGAKTDSQKC